MHLSKGEYTQFSLKGKLNLLNEFGTLLTQKRINETDIKIYYIYDFYVQVFYIEKLVTKVEPLIFNGLLRYYM
jgi:protoheme ferro-lyase